MLILPIFYAMVLLNKVDYFVLKDEERSIFTIKIKGIDSLGFTPYYVKNRPFFQKVNKHHHLNLLLTVIPKRTYSFYHNKCSQ